MGYETAAERAAFLAKTCAHETALRIEVESLLGQSQELWINGRTLAVLLKRGTDTDEVLRRFRAEREILARLEHPNIARLLDGGTTDDGLPYFVMEYVDGQPITTFVAEKQLSLATRLKFP